LGQGRFLFIQEIKIRIVWSEADRARVARHLLKEQDVAQEQQQNRQQRDDGHEADETPVEARIDEIGLATIGRRHATAEIVARAASPDVKPRYPAPCHFPYKVAGSETSRS